MRRLSGYYLFVTVLYIFSSCTSLAFDLFPIDNELIYAYTGTVTVGAKSPDNKQEPPKPAAWKVEGVLILQRHDDTTLAGMIAVDKVTVNNESSEAFQIPDAESKLIARPFRMAFVNNSIVYVEFKKDEPIWIANMKRGLAALLQVHGTQPGTFVLSEPSLHGFCATEYYIANRTDYLSVRKTSELATCTSYPEGIHVARSNIQINKCRTDYQKSVLVGNEALYGLKLHGDNYLMSVAHAKGLIMVHTFESTGEAQLITSEMLLSYISHQKTDGKFDVRTEMGEPSTIEYVEPGTDPTGGRSLDSSTELVRKAADHLDRLADSLEGGYLKFDNPYDSTVVDVIKVMGIMDFNALKKLFEQIDIGTSYRQETMRNLFLEIIPRIGTRASVLLTRDLIVDESKVKPTTAIQLIISLPFHISELSSDLVKDCENLLSLGPNRPDVRNAAILSFATLVYQSFAAGKIHPDAFEKYVKHYFDLFIQSKEYEQRMLYLQALGNLQLGNVVEYLEPIIKQNKDTDIRFLAMWATMPMAHTRQERVFETYWPIFESKSSPVQLRIAAFTMLLISNPTAGRLMSLHRLIQDETCPHLINFYRTTILSISGTTYPCYQHLKQLLSYMSRHLPQSPGDRYFLTGNYLFDVRDYNYGVGSMLQGMLIGDSATDRPYIAYFKLDTEALGKITSQLGLYVKARGVSRAVMSRIKGEAAEYLRVKDLERLLRKMNIPVAEKTPFHLELMFQVESKTVLSFYLNETTFRSLVEGDLIKRITSLIHADSHINMQSVRWPFMIKYSVPTILGTPAEVTIQNTVLTTLRGNTTQQIIKSKISRLNQIDFRYSTYAVCRSSSYNPFLNFEHTINREQGMLAFIPINNEFIVDIPYMSLVYTFLRPKNLTSGFSLKSRSHTTIRGRMTPSSEDYRKDFEPAPVGKIIKLFDYNVDDLGINVMAKTNDADLWNQMLLVKESDSRANRAEGVMEKFSFVLNLIQIGVIHIGTNKDFSLLMNNPEESKIVGYIRPGKDQLLFGRNQINKTHRIEFSMQHKTDEPKDAKVSNILHQWDSFLEVHTIQNNPKLKIYMKLKRVDSSTFPVEWKFCSEIKYDPLVFMTKPHSILMNLSFGTDGSGKSCPRDQSVVVVRATAGLGTKIEKTTNDFYNLSKNEDVCPERILRLNPPAAANYCKTEDFNSISAITDYKMDITFSKMPEWFEDKANRFDHFLSAISPTKVEKFHIAKGVNMSMKFPRDESKMSLNLNGVPFETYNLPDFFNVIDDAKFSYDEIVERYCSIVGEKLYTFNNNYLNLKSIIAMAAKQKCSLLLAADSSESPKFALFLDVVQRKNQFMYDLQVYTGGNVAKYSTNFSDTKTKISFNNEKDIFLNDRVYQFPKNNFDFMAYVNDENVLVFRNEIIDAEIQYDLRNILGLRIDSQYIERIRGLCSSTAEQDFTDYCVKL